MPDALGVRSPSASELRAGGELPFRPFALADEPFNGELKNNGDEAGTFEGPLEPRGVPRAFDCEASDRS